MFFFPFHLGIIAIFLIPLYFLPCIIALTRRAEHYTVIALIDFFLAWTFLGWIAALVWAIADEPLPKSRRQTLS